MKRVPKISFCDKAELRWDRPQPDAAGPIACKADVASKIERLTEAAVGDGVFSYDTVVIEIEAPNVWLKLLQSKKPKRVRHAVTPSVLFGCSFAVDPPGPGARHHRSRAQ